VQARESDVSEQLAASEARYRAVYQHSPVPICIHAIDTFQILDVNEAAVCQYGYERVELIGSDVRRLLHPEDVRSRNIPT